MELVAFLWTISVGGQPQDWRRKKEKHSQTFVTKFESVRYLNFQEVVKGWHLVGIHIQREFCSILISFHHLKYWHLKEWSKNLELPVNLRIQSKFLLRETFGIFDHSVLIFLHTQIFAKFSDFSWAQEVCYIQIFQHKGLNREENNSCSHISRLYLAIERLCKKRGAGVCFQ